MATFDFDTEDGRIAAAQEAGRNVAEFEIRNGHTEPNNWDRDGEHNAGAFSHLAAVGFTRLGCRAYSQTFIDAYRSVFESGPVKSSKATMTDLEAKETITDLHLTAVADIESLKVRIAGLKEDFKTDPWEDTAAQINRLEERLVVKGLHAEALAVALTKF